MAARIRRRSARVAALALFVSSLSGCGPGNERADQNNPAPAEAPEENGLAGASPLYERGEQEMAMDNAAAAAAVRIQGWVRDDLKWPNPRINVCWESLDPAFATERRWVEDALTRSWEAHSAIDFVGFAQCTRGAPGIHILVADLGAQTRGLGTQINGMTNGMRLNFTFGSWNHNLCTRDAATRESCIRANAVHEFGHAIGFVHEHNRHDTPSSCTARRQGSDGDLILTPWDPLSIMNYCNTDRLLQGGRLSALDQSAVEQFYGNEM